MINTIVILEDEQPNAGRLKRLIKTIRPKAEIMAVLDSVGDSVAWFRENPQPDVVMMDIRLADGLSFEIFDKIKLSSPIIFTTAYDEYAVRAFKYNSIDYVLKPVEQEELQVAFEKLESLSEGSNQKSLEGLINFFQQREFRNRFLLPYKDGYKSVLVSDVAYFYSEAKLTRARLHNGTEEIVPQTLEDLEQQLNPKTFFRANRQFIVHIDAIYRIHNYFNGKLKVDIKNDPDTEILVSREKATQLKSWMDF
ncbi:LytTR family DNA-binding domain-containing protein [Xanthocytophaga agilis]|uniref:LytTR family DNA-binding domain-containing protein n=1 Tax=Xanthocytophaga agilis TaxID=3048010 RepID=A0AAE3UIA1_9BACT|nr:LytTR family DNA-binding domain-containing protein [Xanthocytophaga agilis]MDJ1506325.1 LytTR family DNA-binding domain-containing protein [Xanthocytophaga agilis]